LAALQEAIGATLFGVAPKYQSVYCLIGQPESGKSRIIEVVKGLLPLAVQCTLPPQDWDDRFLPAQMFGKLLNHCGELSESRNISGDIFKTIVEGGEITAQHKNQQPFKFRPACAHWFAGNHTPKTRDTSDGFSRRWLFLTFNKRIPAEKQIRDIDAIILEHEREAIAAWAVEGLKRLTTNQHYTLPASHMAAVSEVANSNNSVRHFLSTSPRLRIGKEKHTGLSKTSTTAVELHGEYWNFAVFAGGAQRASLRQFTPMMKQLAPVFGFEVGTHVAENGVPEPVFNYLTLTK
jgi:P4 family phage/plasmid primase-like protien